MDRKAAALLVSRALALLQGICALIEVSYLPERLHSFLHYAKSGSQDGLSASSIYLTQSYRVTIAFLFARILIYLVLAATFWRCPIWIQKALTPESEP